MGYPKPTAVKICGITSPKQALDIANLGASAIGVIGVPGSKRFVPEETRCKIFKNLYASNHSIERVWVVANLPSFALEKGITDATGPSIVQLHGDETPDNCSNLKAKYKQVKFWKALRIQRLKDLEIAKAYTDAVDGLLLDAWSPNALGGTGQRLPLEWLKNKSFNIPWWLAGGISADWIPKVLEELSPFGIDASSKLEISPGVKDLEKVRILIETVKALDFTN